MGDTNLQFMQQMEEMGGGRTTASPTEAEGAKIQYTSHPIKKYRVGKWSFDNALLTLKNEEDEQAFLDAINADGFPERERHKIRKLDMSAAERISRDYRKAQGGATKQTDSSTGERADASPKLGVGDLLDSHKKLEVDDSPSEDQSTVEEEAPAVASGKPKGFGKPLLAGNPQGN